MLVEFSPWETTDTSLRLSVSKRKRPRGGLSSSSSVSEDEFPIAGSIVTTKTGRRKQRSNADSARAVVAVTTPHRVSVLVSKSKGSTTATGAPKTEALDAADVYSLHESARLQYTCRPGKTASFLPNRSLDKVDAIVAAKVPVVFDSKNDRFWALQDGNKRLVAWDAQSEGPDQKGAIEPCILEEVALSLDVLPNGLAVGSTPSGSIFCASLHKEHSSIQVSYISLPDQESNEHDSSHHHAGTFLCVTEAPAPLVAAGNKRKSSTKGSESTVIELYQVFVTGCTVKIMLHDLAPSGDHEESMERRKYRVASFSLFGPGTNRSEPLPAIQDATILPTTIGKPDTVVLYYRQPSEDKQFCCAIDLRRAAPAHPPFPVRCGPRRLALIAPKILAMGVHNKVLICDALNGLVLQHEALPFEFEDDAENFMLLADARKGLLVALFRSGEHLHATTTTIRLENENGDTENIAAPLRLSLAARLAASLMVSLPQEDVEKEYKAPKRVTLIVKGEVEEFKEIHVPFDDALQLIQEAESLIFEKDGDGYEKGHLLDAFKCAVAVIKDSPIVMRDCPVYDTFHRPTEAEKERNQREKAIRDRKGGQTGTAGERLKSSPNGSRSPSEAISGKEQEECTGPAEATPSDSTKQINGVRHDFLKENGEANNIARGNGGSMETTAPPDDAGSFEEYDWSLPPYFVDAVTPIIVRILLHVGMSSNFPIDLGSSIKEDCCQILSTLLTTGRVYARIHFDDPGLEQGRGFVSLLQCMGSKQTEDYRTCSPVNFMHDVLHNCDDVSESQMVEMMHFMLCLCDPTDIACSFLESDLLPADHPNKALSSRYIQHAEQLQSKKGNASLKEKVELTKAKLVIAGSAVLLENILSYSLCNQALLCAALRDTFSIQGATLLCRLLSDLAFARSRLSTDTDTMATGAAKMEASAAQWIPALCDAFGQRMGDLEEDSDRGSLINVEKSITRARQHAEIVLGLEESINSVSAMLIPADGSDQRKRRKIQVDDDVLPAYSIERLVL